MKRMISIISIFIVLLVITSCDIGAGIEKVELCKFPNNIVYYVNESNSVDLTGATIMTKTMDGRYYEKPIYDDEALVITDNIDFSTLGVYEVVIRRWQGRKDNELVGRIPIQVIERG